MEKALSSFAPVGEQPPSASSTRRTRRRALHRHAFSLGLITLASLLWFAYQIVNLEHHHTRIRVPLHAAAILQKCASLDLPAGPPLDFHERTQSDRFVEGTKATLLKNVTIWTGDAKGLEVVTGDLLLDKGLIQAVGAVDATILKSYGEDDLVSVDVGGAWVSPGIVDLHSHMGVGSSPSLNGASDTNSLKGLTQPWLRSLDGLNTHDDSYHLSISGGLTTAAILPGSANAIGGQAFAMKLRPTAERSPTSMLLEPPHSILNGTQVDSSLPPRWRILKQACGENPSRVYSGTRMDTIWSFRQAYDTARTLKNKQDAFCAKAQAGLWDDLGDFPDDLQWEMLVDVLRGRVKIQNHCYEAVDLDDIVRITNEFNFSIAAFHHAHETYLVPDVLKRAWGHPPASALFGTNARYKRESYRGSEFAPRVLADNDLQVVLKSDHPVLNSRTLLHEAQKAHYFGLPENLALASVTSTPATVLGQDHRIGFLKEGYDADVVIWDSHPLALGATPKQVFIDGVPQLDSPFIVKKPSALQHAPKTPNFDKEIEETLKYEGLPPLDKVEAEYESVIFYNVSSLYVKDSIQKRVREIFSVPSTTDMKARGVVVVQKGELVCSADSFDGCQSQVAAMGESVPRINLYGGSLAPGLTTYGSVLGQSEITGEASTSNGDVPGPLGSTVPGILGANSAIFRASDGLQFGGRDTLLAYRAGITSAVAVPSTDGLLRGLGVAFSTGSKNKLDKEGVLQDATAVHVRLSLGSSSSVSTQIATLRALLSGSGEGELGEQFDRVGKGEMPLVVDVTSADIIASVITLKKEIEQKTGQTLKITLSDATEAHLLAKEIGEAGVGVIITDIRPFPNSWEEKRILPGIPLSADNAVALLQANNVTVGVGVRDQWQARTTGFDLGWAALEAGGRLSKTDTIALATVNLESLLGLDSDRINYDMVITTGGEIFDFEAKVTGVISQRKGLTRIF